MKREEIIAKRVALKRQFKEALTTNAVTCECGTHIEHLAYAYRCRWCGLFFCRKCAGEHFGKDEEYEAHHKQLRQPYSHQSAEEIADVMAACGNG